VSDYKTVAKKVSSEDSGMKALQLVPVMRDVQHSAVGPLTVCETPGIGASYALRLSVAHNLTGELLADAVEASPTIDVSEPIIALLRYCGDVTNSTWVFVMCANGVALNGSSPLPAVVVEPGALLAIGDLFWQIASLWQPEPVETPAELRDKPCPVCGGELGLAQVVQCGCGRWTHLENASAPNDKDALNCFIAAGACGGCGRSAVLEPQISPEISDRICVDSLDDHEFDW
jgi:hypothetical protein